MKKLLALTLSALMVGGMLSGCGGSDAEAGVVRVGFMPYYASVPMQVIMDEGLDEKYGFELVPVMFASGGPMAEALGAGEWDIGQIGAGGMSAIPNYDAKLIADIQYEQDGTWIMARADNPIVAVGNTLADYPEVLGDVESITGQTVLGTVGNISHYMAIDYLNKFGMDVSDVNFVHMETANVVNAFTAGEGDIACMGDPTAALKLLNEGYVVIGGLQQQGAPQQDAMIISADYYDNNKEDTVAYMKAFYEACAMLNADPDYEIEMAYKFYSETGGRDVTEDTVRQECENSSLVDASNWQEKEVGAWMRGLIASYVESGTMEASVLEALEANTRLELMEEAMG